MITSCWDNYWPDFLSVAPAHLLAVANPGPDFAIVLKQSIAHGRRTVVWTGIGIGTAILRHITYSLLGLGFLVRSSPLWFDTVKYVGATYIAALGVQALRAKPRHDLSGIASAKPAPSTRGAFLTGFLTNALNPKATLYFLSLYGLLVSPSPPRCGQAGYGG